MVWDPSVINHELEDGEEWFDVMQNVVNIEPEPLFYDVGDYKHMYHVTEAIINSNFLETQVIEYHNFLLLFHQM